VWVAQFGANRIARFDRGSKEFDEYVLPGRDNGPLQIVADGHGSLWVTANDEHGNALLRFDLHARRFEIYRLPTAGSGPVGMLVDSGAIWVAEGTAGVLRAVRHTLRLGGRSFIFRATERNLSSSPRMRSAVFG